MLKVYHGIKIEASKIISHIPHLEIAEKGNIV